MKFTFVGGLLFGAIFGIVCYAVALCRRKAMPELRHVMESGGCGAALFAGLHLALCAFFPSQLIHLTNAAGDHVHLKDLFLKHGDEYQAVEIGFTMSDFHCVHLFLAGVATVVSSGIGLWMFCKEPAQKQG